MEAAPRKRRSQGWRWALLALCVLAIAATAALTWRPAIAPLTEAEARAQRYDGALVARGANLAAIGNCAVCHSASAARPFAGDVGLQTPFGVVYSTNISPDYATGIGSWSQAAFARALREGVSRDGHLLYPAFPYDHYTHLADDDIHALYAYMMTREPLRAQAPYNRLDFPFGFRPLLAGWNLLYLRRGGIASDPQRGAEWNRGAYLVSALGHCSACHTPRTALGGPDRRRYFDGGEAEGWYVPALNANSPSPTPWDAEQLAAYLRSGIAPNHAIAAGPMQGVTASLSQADAGEVRAIATYIVSQMGQPPAQRVAGAAERAASAGLPAAQAAGGDSVDAHRLQIGAQLYATACARCHDGGRADSSGGAQRLPLAVAVYDPDPRSLLRLIREGVRPADYQPGRWMPGFAAELSDEQVLALAAYLRQSAANLPPWPDLPGALRKVKQP